MIEMNAWMRGFSFNYWRKWSGRSLNPYHGPCLWLVGKKGSSSIIHFCVVRNRCKKYRMVGDCHPRCCCLESFDLIISLTIKLSEFDESKVIIFLIMVHLTLTTLLDTKKMSQTNTITSKTIE